MRPLLGQVRAELLMTARRGESLLVTLGIPVMLLVFLATVELTPVAGTDRLDFLVPAVIALAIMSAGLVNLAIATGFERQYGVLKRLGTTPLGRPRLLIAKTVVVGIVEVVQVVVLSLTGLLLGWRPSIDFTSAGLALALGTVAFAALGLLMAGTLRAEATLAASNGTYVLLLLLGGIAVPVESLPEGIGFLASATPSAALAGLLRGALAPGVAPVGQWFVLGIWAVAGLAAAARWFRWE